MPKVRKNASLITVNGVTKSLTEWSREYGISKQLIFNRLSCGWSETDAVTRPKGNYRRLGGQDGQSAYATQGEIA